MKENVIVFLFRKLSEYFCFHHSANDPSILHLSHVSVWSKVEIIHLSTFFELYEDVAKAIAILYDVIDKVRLKKLARLTC